MNSDELISLLGLSFEWAGIGVLLIGAVIASGSFVRDWAGRGLGDAYHSYRANLGRAILLGLEFLIVADIIRTVALEPTLVSLGVLAGIILVRTFLSFALEIEISGTLPWRRGPATGPHEPPAA